MSLLERFRPGPQLNPETYLQERAGKPDFLMVEIGHGHFPVAYRQLTRFTGAGSYIGIEAWLRDQNGAVRETLQALQAEHPNSNITYLDQSLGAPGESNHQKRGQLGAKTIFKGPYDPTTILPSGIADEIVLSNVLGDTHIAHSRHRARRLLQEASRLATENGVVVIREAMSPRKAERHLTKRGLRGTGLQKVGRYTTLDPARWEHLERVYGANDYFDIETSFYQFLTKIASK